jgi:hypothetical protein
VLGVAVIALGAVLKDHGRSRGAAKPSPARSSGQVPRSPSPSAVASASPTPSVPASIAGDVTVARRVLSQFFYLVAHRQFYEARQLILPVQQPVLMLDVENITSLTVDSIVFYKQLSADELAFATDLERKPEALNAGPGFPNYVVLTHDPQTGRWLISGFASSL